MKGIEIIQTQDGSPTLYVQELDEHYHSTHGALQESLHVFIDAGFKRMQCEISGELKVLEIGFGTGMNCMNTLLNSNGEVLYYGVEAKPLSWDLVQQLKMFEEEEFQFLHECNWEEVHAITSKFRVKKLEGKVQSFSLADTVHLIYFDAFGFRAQEEMWTPDIFSKLFSVLAPGGCLVTYSSKGVVRRAMQSVGFEVEKLPGPKGKREMVRAWKKA